LFDPFAVGQSIMAEREKRQEEAKAGYGSKDISALTYFLQLGSTL
jgi:hypothetical protein